MSQSLFQKFYDNIKKNQLIEQNDRIVAGVSGGADSVCLLLLLNELKDAYNLDLSCIHINHQLRGEESDADEEFVKELATRLEISFKSFAVDVTAYAEESHRSTEEAARDLRYEVLRREAHGGKIAVAHNSDDQEETILHNVLRGSGLKGLAGMSMAEGDIIRPLLEISRAEIEEYLRKKGQAYRTDSTNLSDDYTRNRIRKNILPALKSEINKSAGEHLRKLADEARLADEEITSRASKYIPEISGGELRLTPKVFADESLAVKSRIYYLAIVTICQRARDISRVHVEDVMALEDKQSGSSVNLPYKAMAVKEYGEIILRFSKEDAADTANMIDKLNLELSKAKVFKHISGQKIPEKEYTKWFDCDKIKQGIAWRVRQPGDFLILGGVGRKTLNRYMIDAKIERAVRDTLPVLADGSHILWVPGYRISEEYKVVEATENIIEIGYEEFL